MEGDGKGVCVEGGVLDTLLKDNSSSVAENLPDPALTGAQGQSTGRVAQAGQAFSEDAIFKLFLS